MLKFVRQHIPISLTTLKLPHRWGSKLAKSTPQNLVSKEPGMPTMMILHPRKSKGYQFPPPFHASTIFHENSMFTCIPSKSGGAFLAQPCRGRPISFDIVACGSNQFKHGQSHHSASMKECCGVVHALAHWRPYLLGKHLTVMTDHQALTHLFYRQNINQQYARPLG